MRADPVRARLERAGDQMVEITVDHGYRPSSIVARAEVPLRLVFRRRDDDPCSERVVFSSPRLDRRLAPDADTTIVLPPQPAGEVRFTCGMGRYRGSIQLVPAPPRWGRARLRAEVSRLGDALGLAAVLWVFTLPYVMLLSVLVFDAGAIVPVAILGLLAWMAGCLWASRRTRAAVWAGSSPLRRGAPHDAADPRHH
ncbi:MAG TPA: cupredoxin domain-containing protein [Candidatus Limnocylindrales bacterium]|nr:cupredoxin domain-containing protein [Candidatus Limnocylindrales bacterium]